MSTHAGALAIAAGAYRYARRHARDPRFAFGTGKLGDLAGFASAIVLAIVSLGISYESLVRFFHPVAIHYGEATAIAAVGLGVNLLSAGLLWDDHHHDHDGDHHHYHHHHDHNRRSAYWHVLADALTSVVAIAGLLAAWAYGWTWLDPAIGVVGALVIARWSWQLIGQSGAVLLDAAPNAALERTVRERLEQGHDRIADLHVWRLGPGHHGAIVSLVSDAPQPVEAYKARLADVEHLSHLTVEVHQCAGAH
jgi:cation diffusion facilitator family transporter